MILCISILIKIDMSCESLSKNINQYTMFEFALPVSIQKIVEGYACEHPIVPIIKDAFIFKYDSKYFDILNLTSSFINDYVNNLYDNMSFPETLHLHRQTKKVYFTPLKYDICKNKSLNKHRYTFRNFSFFISKILHGFYYESI